MNPRHFTFTAGDLGAWRIREIRTVKGDPLAPANRLQITNDIGTETGTWALHGVTSNERYVNQGEKDQLVARQEGLGRPIATHAALIPIRKTAGWWSLTQDRRREILEEQSGHIETGIRYLPAIARRLHHCRDLATEEPFDFLTWFEFSPADEPRFEELLGALRATREWDHVDREVDVRLTRID
jgi:chlorite dismutase